MRTIIRVLALLPIAAAADPGGTCQLRIPAGWTAPSDIIATDEMSGDVLFFMAAGTSLPADACINAEPGRSMLVQAPPELIAPQK